MLGNSLPSSDSFARFERGFGGDDGVKVHLKSSMPSSSLHSRAWLANVRLGVPPSFLLTWQVFGRGSAMSRRVQPCPLRRYSKMPGSHCGLEMSRAFVCRASTKQEIHLLVGEALHLSLPWWRCPLLAHWPWHSAGDAFLSTRKQSDTSPHERRFSTSNGSLNPPVCSEGAEREEENKLPEITAR